MFTIIILGWILSVMAPPIWIWVCYGFVITAWIIKVFTNLLKALS